MIVLTKAQKSHLRKLNSKQRASGNRNFRHGGAVGGRVMPELTAYYNARARCTNAHRPDFYLYGGRGVKFQFKTFEEFSIVLGPRPSEKHSLDRIDVYGDYEPGNVRWATAKEQANNKRKRL